MTVAQALEMGLTLDEIIVAILMDPAVRNLTKTTLREALEKDPVKAYGDVMIVADVLKARIQVRV